MVRQLQQILQEKMVAMVVLPEEEVVAELPQQLREQEVVEGVAVRITGDYIKHPH